MNGWLLVVEDDLIMGESLADRFALEDYRVEWCTSAEAALQALGRRDYRLVISDLRMPGMGGRELARQIRERLAAPPPIILITGYGSVGDAVEALKEGAADYITKPFDLNALVDKVAALCGPTAEVAGNAPLGVSPAMRQLEAMLPRVAGRARTVLLTGESGVGKERVARRLHELAAAGNAKKPFVAINCAALPEHLLEAELFGYEKGAFTGAHRAKPGLFEAAAGGTLFLDEVGEMSLSVQSKLLRAVQEREVRRIGGRDAIGFDAFIVFATNRDLRAEVEAGRFREDLYYRVNVVHLCIPPLRERSEDIPWLAQGFLAEQSRQLGGARRSIDPQAMAAMMHMPWPGNVRELKHAIERACILATSPLLQLHDIVQDDGPQTALVHVGACVSEAPPQDFDLAGYLQDAERDFISRALHAHAGRITDTAKALGVSRKGLWEKMKRLGLRGEDAGF